MFKTVKGKIKCEKYMEFTENIEIKFISNSKTYNRDINSILSLILCLYQNSIPFFIRKTIESFCKTKSIF